MENREGEREGRNVRERERNKERSELKRQQRESVGEEGRVGGTPTL